MNPRRRLALKLKARAIREAALTPESAPTQAEEVVTEIAETAPRKILTTYDGKAETVIAETKAEVTKTAKTTVKPTIKAKAPKTAKAKKATSTPKTRKTKTTKKSS